MLANCFFEFRINIVLCFNAPYFTKYLGKVKIPYISALRFKFKHCDQHKNRTVNAFLTILGKKEL